jgi:hypothetical protein
MKGQEIQILTSPEGDGMARVTPGLSVEAPDALNERNVEPTLKVWIVLYELLPVVK